MPLPLETPRLILRLAEPADAGAIARFYEENRAHLAPFEPVRPPAWYTEAFWMARSAEDHRELQEDRSMRLFLFWREAPGSVVGSANFTGFVRGAGQYCNMGYALDRRHEGQGLMHEALEAAIALAFGALNLHRIQASYMPHNGRSGRLLERLGFVREGMARDFLRINGAWRDHVLTSLTNGAWREPA